MTGSALLSVLVAAGLLYLFAAYVLAPPVVMAVAARDRTSRRRRHYRPAQDDVMATSRFTIPVSIVLPVTDPKAAAGAVRRLLAFEYPELEVIVVNHVLPEPLAELRAAYGLNACELFYRRSLKTPAVRGIYRSTTEPRLLVVDVRAATRAEALNCGINLARFRYVCCADERAEYNRASLLRSMQAAMEDPAQVVGITTSLVPADGSGADSGSSGVGWALSRLSSARPALARGRQRGLGFVPDGTPGFTLWRRDVVLESGGFDPDPAFEQLDLALRVHRLGARQGQAYRFVHVAAPAGRFPAAGPAGQAAHDQASPAALAEALRRHWRMIGNPRYGRLGMVELPRCAFSTFVAPWLELAALAAVPAAALVGTLTWTETALFALAVCLGNGILLNSAWVVRPPRGRDAERFGALLLLAPMELFTSRPVQLCGRLTGVWATPRAR